MWSYSITSYAAENYLYNQQQQLLEKKLYSLKQRLRQAQEENNYLQNQLHHSTQTNNITDAKLLVAKINLAISSSKNVLASTVLESKYSQQSLIWLDKNIQEIQNQLNSLKIFDSKSYTLHKQKLDLELEQQQLLYQTEKDCIADLMALQKIQTDNISLYLTEQDQIKKELKTYKITQIKAAQLKTELGFATQQEQWLQHLSNLYSQQNNRAINLDLTQEIFYSHENINFIHFSNILTRYKNQLWHMRLSSTNTNSMGELEFIKDQTQALNKQIVLISPLLLERSQIIKQHINLLLYENKYHNNSNHTQIAQLTQLNNKFIALNTTAKELVISLGALRNLLEKAMQHELSARQGLPGFSMNAWLDLGKEIILLPTLSYKLIKGLCSDLADSLTALSLSQWLLLAVSETSLIIALILLKRLIFLNNTFLANNLMRTIKFWVLNFIRLNLWQAAIIVNIYIMLKILVPDKQYMWLIQLSMLFLVFHWINIITRTALVETVHNSTGYDMKLYRSLKALYLFGMIITAITLFLHQLPLVYEIIDLFDRLFLLLILMISGLILYYRQVLNELITLYVKAKRNYVQRIINFVVVFTPSILLINTLIGLFGFINLVWMIIWYESIFIIILISYFLLLGILNDLMELASQLMIRYVTSGWLWSQAILQPVHSILRLILFLGSWMILFILYGWDKQSPIVERLNNLLHHPLISVLNTTITSISIIKLVMALAIFLWAARWTREFVFRLLVKIKDIGIRNSIAILSQYAVIISGVLVCLELLGIDLHELLLLASGLLIALSFGIRDLVNNFACGLLLLFERPVKVGDLIAIDTYEGTVTHIGSRAITLRTVEHVEVIIPNTDVFNKTLTNLTITDDIVRTTINIKIDRRDNPYQIQNIILAVISNNKNILKIPAPEVFICNIVDTTNEFQIHYYVKLRHIASRISVRSEILYSLWQEFNLYKIKLPTEIHELIISNEYQLKQ